MRPYAIRNHPHLDYFPLILGDVNWELGEGTEIVWKGDPLPTKAEAIQMAKWKIEDIELAQYIKAQGRIESAR